MFVSVFHQHIIFFTFEEARLIVQLTWVIYCNKLMRVWSPAQIVMAYTPFYVLISISFFIFQLYFADSSCKNQGEQFQATQKSRSGYVSYNVFQQKSNVFVANCSDLKTWKKVKSERYRHVWFSFILLLSTFIITIVCNSEPCGYLGSAPTDSIFPFEVSEDNRLREGLARSGFTCNLTSCTPCPFGTYQRRLHNGSYSCIECPAGNKGKKVKKSWENCCNL